MELIQHTLCHPSTERMDSIQNVRYIRVPTTHSCESVTVAIISHHSLDVAQNSLTLFEESHSSFATQVRKHTHTHWPFRLWQQRNFSVQQ